MVYSSSKMYTETVKIISIVNGRFSEETCVEDYIGDTIQIDRYEGNSSCVYGKIQELSRRETGFGNREYGVLVNDKFYFLPYMNIANLKIVRGEYV
jgi:hypothetical protein